MARLIFLVINLLIAIPVFADNSFYCSQSNQYVYLGDSIDSVFNVCGQPQKTQTKIVSMPQKTKKIMQWIYNIQPHNEKFRASPTFNEHGLILNFYKKQLKKILAEGQPVSKTTYCNTSKPITLGMTVLDVQAICGLPNQTFFVKHASKPQKTQETIWTYNSSQYGNGTRLIFRQGKLYNVNNENS